MMDLSEAGLHVEAGRLCLAFANTAEWHASAHPEEHLNSYTDVLDWGRKVGLLGDDQCKELLVRAAADPAGVAGALGQALALREALYGIFSHIAHQLAPASEDLAVLNAALMKALPSLRIVPVDSGYAWVYAGNEADLDGLLGAVALSAAGLLTSPDLSRVKACADERGCGWLFMDMTRNRSRRWCDMSGCGNRAKARRHYQRQRESHPEPRDPGDLWNLSG